MVRRTRLAVCAAGVAKSSQAPEKGSMMLMMMTMDDVMMSRTTTGTGAWMDMLTFEGVAAGGHFFQVQDVYDAR